MAEEVAAAVGAAAAAKPVGSATHVEAVRALRQLLSNYEDPPVRWGWGGGKNTRCQVGLGWG